MNEPVSSNIEIDIHHAIEVNGIVYVPLGETVTRSARSDRLCPNCGNEAGAARQNGVSRYGLTIDEDGETVNYDGNGTDTDALWNTFDQTRLDGLPILLCSVCDEAYITQHVKDLDEI